MFTAARADLTPSLQGAVVRSSRRAWERRYGVVILGLDIGAALIASLSAYIGRFGDEPTENRQWLHIALSAGLPALWITAMFAFRAYEPRFLFVGFEEFRRVLVASVAVIATVATLSWATKAEIARGYVIIALPLATALTLLGRYAQRKHLHHRRRSGECMSDVLLVGHTSAAAELVRQLRREVYHGIRVVGACVPDGKATEELVDVDISVAGSFDDIDEAVHRTGADSVTVLTCPEMDGPALRRLSWQLARSRVDLLVASALMDVAGPRIAIRPVCGLPLLHVDEPELTGARRLAKACVDRAGSAFALLLLLPVLVTIGGAVRCTSPGPALFRQTRVGWQGREFTMLKFRTMSRDAEARLKGLTHLNAYDGGPLFKVRNDPRVTPLGRWLRRTSLDELPQLINVLRGEMSLVGPRPPLPSEAAQYVGDVGRRLVVKPGLTGLWQISGRADLDWEEAVRLDLRYVDNWSLTLDAMIVWKTLFAMVRRDGAY